MKQPARDPDLVSLSVRVPRDLADRLKVIADDHDRPVAAHVRRLIKEHIDAVELDEAA
jgi:predicted DNA-binding protein